MVQLIRKNWWMLVVRGVVAIVFGVSILSFPLIALASLVFLWGAYALIDGVVAVLDGLRGRHWFVVVEGGISIIACVITFMIPEITVTILLYIIAFRTIAMGTFQIFSALRLRKEIAGEFWIGLSGFISILLGVFLIASPEAGILTLLWLLAFYAISFGVMLIGWGLRIRSASYHDMPNMPRGMARQM